MKKIILKINHIVFYWYYSRCGDHFRQWTFFNSIKLLIANYKHTLGMLDAEQSHNLNLTRDNTKLRDEINDYRIKMVANDKQIDFVNKRFGTKYSKGSDN